MEMEAVLDLITVILIITWLISQMVLFAQLNKKIKRVETKTRLSGLALEVQGHINDLTEKQFEEIRKILAEIKEEPKKKGKK